jgi:hypothetical protein
MHLFSVTVLTRRILLQSCQLFFAMTLLSVALARGEGLVFVALPEAPLTPEQLADVERVAARLLDDGEGVDPPAVSPFVTARPMADGRELLEAVDDGADAFFEADFERAEVILRGLLQRALASRPDLVGRPGLAARLAEATSLLARIVRAHQRPLSGDETLLAALDWVDLTLLSSVEHPPELLGDLDELAKTSRACEGQVILGTIGVGAHGCVVQAGLARLEVAEGGRLRLPCGDWRLRMHCPVSGWSDWERVVRISARDVRNLPLLPRLERHLLSWDGRMVRVRGYEGVAAEIEQLVGASDVTLIRVDPAPPPRLARWDGGAWSASEDALAVKLDGASGASAPVRGARVVTWSLLGATTASLAGAVTLNLLANQEARTQSTGAGYHKSRIEGLRDASVATYVAGGVFAASTVVWYWLADYRTD